MNSHVKKASNGLSAGLSGGCSGVLERKNPLAAILEKFRLIEFRGSQKAIIESVIARKNVLVVMPTGGGKSICYQGPAWLYGESRRAEDRIANEQRSGNASEPKGGASASCKVPMSIVLSPLISLMKDQVDALSQKGVDCTYINSSIDRRMREERLRSIVAGRFDLVLVTPERFRSQSFRDAIGHRAIELLAIDEAHCISQWGHDFRPDYSRIAEIRKLIGDPPCIASTATATPKVQRDIAEQLGMTLVAEDSSVVADTTRQQLRLFHEGIARPNLELSVKHVWGFDEKLTAIRSMLPYSSDNTSSIVDESGKYAKSASIVYVTLIKTLAQFSEELSREGVHHLVYHGDLDRSSRRHVQERFMTEDSPIVLATNAFGMGIDKPNIRLVVHADVPSSLESYYQEIGRAGRDGKPSQCCLLYDQTDLETQMEFLRWSNPDSGFYSRLLHLLRYEMHKIHAFGFDWMQSQLIGKNKDGRLDTALGMLERFGIVDQIANLRTINLLDPEFSNDLPEELFGAEHLGLKLRNSQEKLLAMVQYATLEAAQSGDYGAFLRDYFGAGVIPKEP